MAWRFAVLSRNAVCPFYSAFQNPVEVATSCKVICARVNVVSVNIFFLVWRAAHKFDIRRDPTLTPRSHNKTVAIMANAKTKTPEEVVKENDLLPKLVTHLDRHLIFPLLQFVGEQDEEPTPEITKANTKVKYELLKKTNMTDYVAQLYCQLEGLDEPPAEYATKREEVLEQLEKYNQESEKITDLLSREDVVTGLRSDKVANLEFLKKEHGVCLSKVTGEREANVD
jgi:hypothetical protein